MEGEMRHERLRNVVNDGSSVALDDPRQVTAAHGGAKVAAAVEWLRLVFCGSKLATAAGKQRCGQSG